MNQSTSQGKRPKGGQDRPESYHERMERLMEEYGEFR